MAAATSSPAGVSTYLEFDNAKETGQQLKVPREVISQLKGMATQEDTYEFRVKIKTTNVTLRYQCTVNQQHKIELISFVSFQNHKKAVTKHFTSPPDSRHKLVLDELQLKLTETYDAQACNHAKLSPYSTESKAICQSMMTAIQQKNKTALETQLRDHGHKIQLEEIFCYCIQLTEWVDVVDQFIELGVNVSHAGGSPPHYTPLHLACIKGSYPLTLQLLIHKASTEAVAETSHKTPLLLAASLGQAQLVEVLVKAKSAINATDQYFNTPLMLALKNDRIEAALTLIELGADIRFINKNNDFPLLEAARIGNNELFYRVLFEECKRAEQTKSSMIRQENKQKKTPLLKAVRSHMHNHNDYILTELLKRGALNEMSLQHKNPICCALALGNIPALELMFSRLKAQTRRLTRTKALRILQKEDGEGNSPDAISKLVSDDIKKVYHGFLSSLPD